MLGRTMQHIHKTSVAEMPKLKWMCVYTKLLKLKNDHICQKVQVAHIENKMRNCHLRWFGHVLHRPPDAPVCRCEPM